MGSLMIGDFGEHEGIRIFRVCGAKHDIMRLIDEAYTMGHEFIEMPLVEHVIRQQYSTLLKIKVATEGNHADT